MQRVGLYAWGGPGTIRLLKVKYHSPQVDEASFFHLYSPTYLEEAQQKLGVTDMWVSYSWGFSDTTEQPDRHYITERLPHFHKRDIAAHAYVQGLNVVTDDFKDCDIFCRDSHGRRLPYSRGRSLTCPNNPAARQLIVKRVQAASQADFSGVFVDNILFGLPPFFVRRDYASFFGCCCDHCRRAFREQFGYRLPAESVVGETQLKDYLAFRCESVFKLIQELSEVVHASRKQFGINLYDPYWFTPEVHFGYRMKQIAPLLNYYLIENFALGQGKGIDNRHLMPLISSEPQKPTFVVSYRNGIGYDSSFGQPEVNLIWSEAAALGYAPCLKATEYIEKGKWHALDLGLLQKPVITTPTTTHKPSARVELKASTSTERHFVRLTNRHYARLAHLVFESKSLATWLTRSHLMTVLLRKSRRYNLDVIHPSIS